MVFLVLMFLGAGLMPVFALKGKKDRDVIDIDKISEIVREIEEVYCKMSDEELLKHPSGPLTKDDIKKIREFCKLPTKQKEKILIEKIKRAKKKKACEGKIVSRVNTYICYYDGLNFGIPEYEDLGLSSSTCTWHDRDYPEDCKIEGKIACLWGCTNVDPNLGWHIKEFNSVKELENEIIPKGYHKVADYYGGDYRRWVGYGYSYQVHPIGDNLWHNEGPEPSPEFNWYAYLRGWWPVEVYVWHDNC